MAFARENASLEGLFLEHLMAGRTVEEFAGQLGCDLAELGRALDLKRVKSLAQTFQWLESFQADMAACRERSTAAQTLGRMIRDNKTSETMRRACAALLRMNKHGRRPGRMPQRETQACQFLRQVLSDGPRPAREVMQAARQMGFCRATLARAKATAGVETLRKGFGRSGHFLWRLGRGAEGGEQMMDRADTP